MRAARPVREPWATFSVSRMCPAGVMLGNPKRALSSRTNNNSDVCHRQRRFTCTRRSHRTRRTRSKSTNSITRRHPERHRAAFGVFAQPPCSARCALGVRQGRSRGSTGPRPPSRCQTKKKKKRKIWGLGGIEPPTTSTLRKYHATRPKPQTVRTFCKFELLTVYSQGMKSQSPMFRR